MEKFTKNTSSEKPENSETFRRTVTRALFGAFLSTLAAQNVEAADFSKGTGWGRGALTMWNARETTKNEFAGVYIVAPGEKGKWFNPTNGDEDSVVFDEELHLNTIDTYVVETRPDEEVYKVCVAHTHPTDIHNHVYGPSSADFELDADFSKLVDDEIAQTYDVDVDVQGIVFEQYGVWYYDVIRHDSKDKSFKSTASPELNKLKDDVRKSLEDPAMSEIQQELSVLTVQAALLAQGVNSRFVKYADFFEEPPCAGVNYKKPSSLY